RVRCSVPRVEKFSKSTAEQLAGAKGYLRYISDRAAGRSRGDDANDTQKDPCGDSGGHTKWLRIQGQCHYAFPILQRVFAKRSSTGHTRLFEAAIHEWPSAIWFRLQNLLRAPER